MRWSLIPVLLLAGCQNAPAPTSGGRPAVSASADDPYPAARVEIRGGSFADVEKAIAQQRGKVVVVDFWAEYCPPCVDGMPHLVELQQRYGQDQLVVISVNLDEPANRPRALAMLQRNQARLINLARDPQHRDWQVLTFQIIPHSWIYDREGKRVYDGSGLHHLVTAQVEQLLTR